MYDAEPHCERIEAKSSIQQGIPSFSYTLRVSIIPWKSRFRQDIKLNIRRKPLPIIVNTLNIKEADNIHFPLPMPPTLLNDAATEKHPC
jgi:hypothetical protein